MLMLSQLPLNIANVIQIGGIPYADVFKQTHSRFRQFGLRNTLERIEDREVKRRRNEIIIIILIYHQKSLKDFTKKHVIFNPYRILDDTERRLLFCRWILNKKKNLKTEETKELKST
ncbi:hypothetical protein ABEB36_008246 [Hypothenemus hampei]|uniref:Uncharacterized protein n=1 Tax=Hypothenemus hampei TaxID=57062 RepID=A0ABD1ELA4_HYPHA